MHTLRQLKELDTIIYNEGVRKMMHEETLKLNCEMPLLPVLNEGVIKIEDSSPTERTYLYFKHQRATDGVDTIHLENYAYNHVEYTMEYFFKGSFSFGNGLADGDKKETIEWQGKYAKMPQEKQREFFVFYANLYISVIAYLAYLSLSSVAKHHPATKPRRTAQPSVAADAATALPRKRSEVVIEGIRIITDNPEALVRHVKRGIIRHVESWTVRGHYRHLKSGKDVFVKAHRKGNQAAEAKGKLYRLDSAAPVR